MASVDDDDDDDDEGMLAIAAGRRASERIGRRGAAIDLSRVLGRGLVGGKEREDEKASGGEYGRWVERGVSGSGGGLTTSRTTEGAWMRRTFAASTIPLASSSSSSSSDGGKREEDESGLSEPAAAPEAENTWVDRALPSSVVPYAKLVRLDRPVGSALLAWPCFWSIALAADPGSLPDATTLGLFGVGAFLLRGAGCTVNDLWDRDIDGKVARTRNRPIASGAISVPKAVAFLGAQLGLGLGILLQLNDYSKILGASSLALVAAYPGMKRVTNWPQAFLGLTFNWGALLGWAAVRGSCDWGAVLPLYASGVAWTLVYDTIYAHQDKDDDVKVGVKSTALHFGKDTKKYLSAFAMAGSGALCASGAYVGLDFPFYLGVASAASHLAWQIGTVNLDDREDCAAKFRSNSTYGALVFAGIVAGKVF